MTDTTDISISSQSTIRQALAAIELARSQFAMVVDDSNCLIGTITDGDIRRGLLAGMTLDSSIDSCMCCNPKVAYIDQSDEEIFSIMRLYGLHHLPIVSRDNYVYGFRCLDDLISPSKYSNPVVIMAGGLGSRLEELTRDKPKPMLPVGGRPLLESLINRYVLQGFSNIWLSVNYHSGVIESYFGSGSSFNANIQYIHEDKRLGTAGSLSLLPFTCTEPIIVSNADLLAHFDCAELLNHHISTQSVATMAVREYVSNIPYGVVVQSNGLVKNIQEKPSFTSLVNAGIYILSPPAINKVPYNTFYDMPHLFQELLTCKLKVSSHLIEGYWLDIGRRSDYDKANRDFDFGFYS